MRALPISRTARRRFELDGATLAAPDRRLAPRRGSRRRAPRRDRGQREPGTGRAERPGRRARGARAAPRDLPPASWRAPRSSCRRAAWTGRPTPSPRRSGRRRRGGLLDDVGAEFPDVEARPTPGPPRGAAAHPGRQREPRGATAAGARRRHAAPPAATRRGHRRGRAVRGGAAGHRAATARRCWSSCARRHAPTRRRSPASCATSGSSWGDLLGDALDDAARPDAAHARRHRRGGARAPPPVRRRRGRRRGRRPRRGAGPHRARRRARAVLQRLRVDAAARPHREEHPRLARPAVAALRHATSGRWTRSPTRSSTGSRGGASPGCG